MSDRVLIEGLLFKGFVESSKDFKIIYENKNSTAFKVKPLENSQNKKWSYLVNFNTGTIRRIVAISKYNNKRKKKSINKFSYYCNQKEKYTFYPYRNNQTKLEPYRKIYNHLAMFRKLIDIERNYKHKYSLSKMRHEENYPYGS